MKRILMTALAAGLLAASAQAQDTTGYLYYVAGSTIDEGSVNAALDGPTNADRRVHGVLVANVTINDTDVSITNWRYAHNAGGQLPNNVPGLGTDVTWMFLENCVHVHDGRLYAGPADWNGATATTASIIAYADIDEFGAIGAWSFSDVFPSPPADQAIGATALVDFGSGNAWYYVIGGGATSTDRVLKAQINSGTGALSAWTTATPIPLAEWFNRATAVGETIVIGAGNRDVTKATYYTAANSADGTLGTWTSSGDYAAGGARWDYVMTKATSPNATDYVVIAGGSGQVNEVFTSAVTAGVPGTWNAANTLPTGVRRVTGIGIDDVVLVIGGTDTTSSSVNSIDLIQVGRIDDAGQITWDTSTNIATVDPLPQARSFGGAAFYPTAFPETPAEATGWQQYD